jgi:phosphoglycerate dehydrogenase-like enzyme
LNAIKKIPQMISGGYMNILITAHKSDTRDIYFPVETMEAFKKLGNIRINESDMRFSEEELAKNIRDIDICVTHWGCPQFSKAVLKEAGNLKLITHAAGSVANIITDEVYEKGIKVCSANNVMAKYVAESVLAYILTGLKLIPGHDRGMRNKKLWERKIVETKSLFGSKIGLIGLGTVGMFLLELLKPFDVEIKIFDPYIDENSFKKYKNIKLASLEETLSWADVISIHASLTPETRHLINADKLKLIKDGTLFVNTARGAVVDEKALISELNKNRLMAVLDVYEEEPLNLESPLRELENVILLPHIAGAGAREQMAATMLEEIARFIKGEPLEYEVSYKKYKLMTKE